MIQSPINILINCPLSDEQAAIIRNLSPRIELHFVPRAAEALPPDMVREMEIVYTTSANFEPRDAPRLRWVQTNTAAVSHLLNKPIWQSEIPIANVSGAYSVAVAECALAMLLALSRKVPTACRLQKEHKWDEAVLQGEDLQGKTMGIVGYGSIGRQIARIVNAMGLKVLACKRRPEVRTDPHYLIPGTGDPEGIIPAAWFGIDQIPEMLQQSDIAMITLPLTDDTHHLIGERALAALPSHAWVLNVGRGPVIDEAALIECLQQGRIAAAALDVFEQEPLPDDNPLWDMPNVFVMPHIASWTTAQAQRAAGVLIENLKRDLTGQPLLNVVDRKQMY